MARKGRRYFGSSGYSPRAASRPATPAPTGHLHWPHPEGHPLTFDSLQYAEAYLSRVHGDIQAAVGVPRRTRKAGPPTLGTYAAAWLAGGTWPTGPAPTTPRPAGPHPPHVRADACTRDHPGGVREWHAALKGRTGPTMRAHAYGLLRTIMNTAVADEVIVANPCRVRGGGSVRRAKTIRPPPARAGSPHRGAA